MFKIVFDGEIFMHRTLLRNKLTVIFSFSILIMKNILNNYF
jgi:hypothetical protein